MVYTCPRCSYTTKLIGNLKHHLNKKNICEDVNGSQQSIEDIKKSLIQDRSSFHHICPFCTKPFKTWENLYQHKRTCKQKTTKTQENTTDLSNKTNTEDVTEKLNKLELQVKELMNENIALRGLQKKRNEDYFQKLLETHYDCTHMKYSTGVTDLTRHDFHGEIKVWKDWKMVIGQLLTANLHMKRKKLCAYLFGAYTKASKERAVKDLKQFGIDAYDLLETEDEITMVNMDTNESVVFNLKVCL